MEQYKIEVIHFPASNENKFFGSCPQCGRYMTNEDDQWQICIQRLNNASYDAIKSGNLTLAGQGFIRMCGGCYGAVKEYFKI